jgi:uncharacterized protein YbjQ (UPF0145 family)
VGVDKGFIEIIATTDEIPGERITQVLGLVHGSVVRSRSAFSDVGAGLKGLVGGELKGYTTLLEDSRKEAVRRMRDAAEDLGADAIVGTHFSSSDISDLASEVLVYGTAVRLAERPE